MKGHRHIGVEGSGAREESRKKSNCVAANATTNAARGAKKICARTTPGGFLGEAMT